MIAILGYIVGLAGLWEFQDGFASIVFYNKKEGWWWNQAVRAIRCVWGIILVAIGGILIWVG